MAYLIPVAFDFVSSLRSLRGNIRLNICRHLNVGRGELNASLEPPDRYRHHEHTVAFCEGFHIPLFSRGSSMEQISGEGSTTRGIGNSHEVVFHLHGENFAKYKTKFRECLCFILQTGVA